jgi:outer membrane lipoprotein-sorting protein
MKKNLFILCLFILTGIKISAQDIKTLLKQVKDKYDKVNDYTADGKLKTNVVFIKAPIASVKIYYKKPDKLKIKNEKGVSFIPKGSVNINLNNILGLENFEAIASGTEKINDTICKVVKIFPLSDEENITRATLYIDEKQLVVMKSVISTKENGTYELIMTYKNYTSYGLPDKVQFTFSTKEYKLPKGISIDYDNGTDKDKADKEKSKKGKVEITYTNYVINKGVPDSVFD